jgi:hypothetical protein
VEAEAQVESGTGLEVAAGPEAGAGLEAGTQAQPGPHYELGSRMRQENISAASLKSAQAEPGL